jgi:hypothetical protein
MHTLDPRHLVWDCDMGNGHTSLIVEGHTQEFLLGAPEVVV